MQRKSPPIMYLLHTDLFPDYSSCPAMFSFPLSLFSSAPHATAQLFLVLLEGISRAKLCWMGLLIGEPGAFSLPFHLHLPLLIVPTGSNQLVRIIDSSSVGCTLISNGRRSSSLFPLSFLGLPLLCGVFS
jgi:hypothetical protein